MLDDLLSGLAGHMTADGHKKSTNSIIKISATIGLLFFLVVIFQDLIVGHSLTIYTAFISLVFAAAVSLFVATVLFAFRYFSRKK